MKQKTKHTFPASRSDHVPLIGILEDDAGIVSPGSTKIYGAFCATCCAIAEDDFAFVSCEWRFLDEGMKDALTCR